MAELDSVEPKRFRPPASELRRGQPAERGAASDLRSPQDAIGKRTLVATDASAGERAAPGPDAAACAQALARARQQIEVLRAANTAGSPYASCEAAYQLRDALTTAQRAATAEQQAAVAECAAVAEPVLAARFTFSAEALEESRRGGRDRQVRDRDVAAWRARVGAQPEPQTEHKQPVNCDRRYAHTAPAPVTQAPAIVNETERRARAAAFDQLAAGHTRERITPSDVEIPASLETALEHAKEDSLRTHKEHEEGGNIVTTGRGEYRLRRGERGDRYTFDPTLGDVGRGETLVGTAHTHPYRDEQADDCMANDWGTFSGDDLANLVSDPPEVRIKLVRSGRFTFMIARTREFDQLVAADELDETGHSPLYAAMMATFDEAFDTHDGPFSDKVEVAVMSTCRTYHLAYYEGAGRELHRMTGGAS